MTNKSKAQELLESITSEFNESTVTISDVPNFNELVSKLTVTNKLIPMPHAAHITTVNNDGHTYTVMDANHPAAPKGMVSSITSSPAGMDALVQNKELTPPHPVNSGNAS